MMTTESPESELVPPETDEEAFLRWQALMRPLLQRHNKTLCDVCLAVLWSSLDPMGRGLNQRQAHECSISLSCHFCDLVRALLATAMNESLRNASTNESVNPSWIQSVIDGGDSRNAKYVFGWRVYDFDAGGPLPQLRLFTQEDDISSIRIPGRPIDPTGNGQHMLRRAAQWVTDCSLNHASCQLGCDAIEDAVLPTRVINIGMPDSGAPHFLTTNGQRGKWAALSYRWGNATTASKMTDSATTENIRDLEDKIPTEMLSPTFLDAMQITRSLGLQYLWIDRLCILQDSESDWINESAQMPLIYKNAHVTVAAGSSKDGTGGIFGKRRWTEFSEQLDLPILCRQGISIISVDIDSDLLTSPFKLNYLQSRAWCFQEAQLSRRRLIFDREQTSFICIQHGLQEKWAPLREASPSSSDASCHSSQHRYFSKVWADGSTRFGQQMQGPEAQDRNHFLHLSFQLQSCEASLAGKVDILRTWYDMVKDYSGRDLTFASDKLIAIAGVAELVRQAQNDEYVAGIWKSSLPESLLWSPHVQDIYNFDFRYKICSRPDTYVAPTWSWAALCGKIWFPVCTPGLKEENRRVIVTVLDVFTDASSTVPYGSVSTGHLRIRGYLARAFLYHWRRREGEGEHWPCVSRSQKSQRGEVCCIPDIPSEICADSLQKLWVLQITDRDGLLLLQLSANDERYSRLGIFTPNIMEGGTPLRFGEKDLKTITIV